MKDLRQSRWLLFRRLDAVKTTHDFLAYQVDLANAIREAERGLQANGADADALSLHIGCLRLYADALAWRTLHPHSIRQLAKNAGHPPTLLTQGPAFDNVLAVARELYEETGLPVLIADITNVIKIGDVIQVTDPECPKIVECKLKIPKPQHLMQGRMGRQLSRMMGTTQYLRKGVAKVFGEQHVRVVVESQHRKQRNWRPVEELCREAIDAGKAFRELNHGDYLWALRSELQDTVLAEVGEKARGPNLAQLGTSLGLMRREDGLYPPPSAWPISQEARFELIEGSLLLFHLVFYDALVGDCGDGRTIRVQDGDYPIVVNIRGAEFPLSRRFIYDVVYGFETVDSCVRGLLTFAEELEQKPLPDLADVPNNKRPISRIETTSEAHDTDG